MSSQVRPLRAYSMPRMVEMITEWRGESKVLVELVKELEFRQGKVAQYIKAAVQKQLAKADWDRKWERHERWEQCMSLVYVLRDAEPRLQNGVKLLQAAGYPIIWRSQAPVETRNPVRRAIAWNDGGRLTTETGAPGSVERCRLLIEVFTRAIAVVRRKGLERGGLAADHWPQDRKLVLVLAQEALRKRCLEEE